MSASKQELNEFRVEVAAWLKENNPSDPGFLLPQTFMEVGDERQLDFLRGWQHKIWSAGYLGMAWPKEYGGGGVDAIYQSIVDKEMRRLAVPICFNVIGLGWAGPLINDIGTEQQKSKYLKGILSAEDVWCQGFSEPGAGSDLANVSTSAKLKGNEYIISGSKIWTSEANKADWMYCLVRTAKTEKKQAGISFILLNLKQPNIEIKPIKLLSGQSPFCQVFFDDVVAKEPHRIANENEGWKVAKRLLEFERTMMADLGSEGAVDIEPIKTFKNTDALNAPGQKKLHKKIIKHELRNHLIDLTMARTGIESKSGFSPAALTLKYISTEETQARWELNVASLGAGGLKIVEKSHGQKQEIAKSFFYSKAYTIAGGSSEVQLNIIAKHILGLPS